jgi:serine/threonine protein kinase
VKDDAPAIEEPAQARGDQFRENGEAEAQAVLASEAEDDARRQTSGTADPAASGAPAPLDQALATIDAVALQPPDQPSEDAPTVADTAADPVAALEPDDPERVGPYKLLGRLGMGGMGAVYLAQGPDGGCVALKILRAELSQEDAFLRRFHREVTAARRVAGFCTARVIDAHLEGPQPYLATEYIEGLRLDRLLARQGPLTSSNLHGLAVGVATALAAIHATNLVHRDLKASNVILTHFGPRIIDFGIARVLDARALTKGNMTLGTPGWMAPEQLAGRPPSPATDIFAWGALIASSSTGRHPFGVGTFEEVALRITSGLPDLEDLPGPIRRIVERALAKDPDERPTAQGLLAALLSAQSDEEPGAGGVAEPTRLVEYLAPQPERRTPNDIATSSAATLGPTTPPDITGRDANESVPSGTQADLSGSTESTVPLASVPGPVADRLNVEQGRVHRLRRGVAWLLAWLTSLGAAASGMDFRSNGDAKLIAIRLVVLWALLACGVAVLPRRRERRVQLVGFLLLALAANLLTVASVLFLVYGGRLELFIAGIAGAFVVLLTAFWVAPKSN